MSENLLGSVIDIVPMLSPVNLGSARTSDVVSLKNHGAGLLCFYKVGGATNEDPTLTVLQCTSVAASNAKALNFTTIYTKQGTLTSVGTWTKTTQAAANTYTNTTASESECLWVIPIKADDLDVDNGFDCIEVTIADAGTAGQHAALFWIAGELRFQNELGVTAIAN